MKILDTNLCTSYIVETDDEDWPTYRRLSKECWENAMGESWETVYNDTKLKELEESFLKYFEDLSPP